jgi:ribosomal protein RSM22 (predicted rRNA methylase)
MGELPEPLRYALGARLSGIPTGALSASVDRLIGAYRSGAAPDAPILAGDIDVAAYAAYRMPATYSAVRAALDGFRLPEPPASLLDVGGGTGAAAWAVVDAYPSVGTITVVDQVASALRFGAQLASDSPSAALRGASWVAGHLPGVLPPADLATVSYVLGELAEEARPALIEAVAGAAPAVIVVEPGTPAGYARILAARTHLISLGRTIVAPCPHQLGCPLPAGKDWCHFGARVNRSALHRRIKDAELSYEDEKFAYVVAVPPVVRPDGDVPTAGRVLRRPTQRKGLVSLRLCQPDGAVGDRIVTKRSGDDYRRARDTSWGDAF